MPPWVRKVDEDASLLLFFQLHLLKKEWKFGSNKIGMSAFFNFGLSLVYLMAIFCVENRNLTLPNFSFVRIELLVLGLCFSQNNFLIF